MGSEELRQATAFNWEALHNPPNSLSTQFSYQIRKIILIVMKVSDGAWNLPALLLYLLPLQHLIENKCVIIFTCLFFVYLFVLRQGL